MHTLVIGPARRSRVRALLIVVALLIAVAVLVIQANSIWSRRPLEPVQPTFLQGGPQGGPQAVLRTVGVDGPRLGRSWLANKREKP
jgi:hypothetical protein